NMSLKTFIDNIINPTDKLKNSFEKIALAGKNGDLKTKNDLKQQELFFVTPTVKVKKVRNYDSIIGFLPFMVVEYDKIKYPELMRDYIFNTFKSCIFAFCSPSKTGAKFIFRIPIVKSVEQYK